MAGAQRSPGFFSSEMDTVIDLVQIVQRATDFFNVAG